MKKRLPEPAREKGVLRFDVEEGVTCVGLLEIAGIDTGRALVVLLNGRYAEPGKALRQGDVVSVFPPVAGG